MIPEVEGTRPLGSSRKRVPECLKGPKTTYTIIAITENTYYFAEIVSVRCRLIVLQRRRASIRLPYD